MKLCNFYVGDEIHIGALTARGIVDVTEAGITSDIVSPKLLPDYTRKV